MARDGRRLYETFERAGVRFRYPAGWTAETTDLGRDGWAVTVQSPGTAFALVSLRADADDPSDLADQTLTALRADYPTLDADAVMDTLAGMPAVGHDIEFLTLDTSVVCRTRCADTTGGVLLVMAQVSEYDRAAHDPALRALAASVGIDEE